MWNSVICLPLILMASGAVQGELPILETPSRLRLVTDSNTSVVILWDFVKPENVSLPQIEFVLLLDSEGEPTRKLYPRVGGMPYKYQLKNLEPSTRYKVSLWASSADWRDSGKAMIFFTFQGLESPSDFVAVVTSLQRKEISRKLPKKKIFPILGAPTGLRVGKDSDTSVVVLWDFVKPENVSLSNIEFVLLLESKGKPTMEFYPRFRRLPLEYRLQDLTPMTAYNLTLSANAAKWRESPPVVLSFVTQGFDWPTPVITDVKGTPREHFVEYRVQWQVQYLVHWLEYFDVEVCARNCFQLRQKRDQVEITLPMRYRTSFSMRVIATYNIPVIHQVKRYSKYYTGNTGDGTVRKVLEPIRAKQEGNRVKLGWLPSFAPQGPLSYYEIFACDMGFAQRRAGPRSVVPSRSPSLVGDVFEMNLNVKGDRPRTIFSNLGSGQCSSHTPPLLVVIKRTEAAVRFRVAFRDPYDEEDDIFDPSWNSKHLRLGTGVAEAFGLSEDAPLYLKIRSCLIYAKGTVDVCGNFSDFVLPPNAGEPSRVSFLTWLNTDSETAVVTWEKPEIPRGPIAGYKISIRKIIDNKPEAVETVHSLNSSTRSFVVNPLHPEIAYIVGVVAFNIDLEDFTEVIGEDWAYVLINYQQRGHRLVLIGFFCLCLASCVVSLVCSLWLRYRKREEIELRIIPRREVWTSCESRRGDYDRYSGVPPRTERTGSQRDDGIASPHIYEELPPRNDEAGNQQGDGRESPVIYSEIIHRSDRGGSQLNDGIASPHIYDEPPSSNDEAGSQQGDGRESPIIYSEIIHRTDQGGSQQDDGRASSNLPSEVLAKDDETESRRDDTAPSQRDETRTRRSEEDEALLERLDALLS